MPVHTSVFFKSITGSTAKPVYAQLTAANDDVMGLRSDNLVPGADMRLVALAATADGLGAARIRTPRTVISPAYARPVNTGSPLFASDPRVSCFVRHPVQVLKGEEIQASAWVVSGTPKSTTLVAWFCDQHEALPAGESFWVTFTASVGATAATAGWYATKNFTFVEQPTLPSGRYAIVGMHLMQATTPTTEEPPPGYQFVCGRLIIPNRVCRPGALVLQTRGELTPTLQSDGELGVWETFDAKLPPSLELFSIAAGGDADGTIEGYLRIIQIGS
jgi:hypothetical protein